MANKEVPDWYGGHDNPHHAGQHSHKLRIAAAEADLEEWTGIKGKQVKLPKIKPKEVIIFERK